MNVKVLAWLSLGLLTNPVLADTTPIRIGVLASGTLAWELAAMDNAGLSGGEDFSLQSVAIANQQAGKVALQAGSVDLIVSDWIWVSAMRAQGNDLAFYPYSASAGGLMVAADSDIRSLNDLKGKKLGIAGGELDKNWTLLQSLGLQQGLDLNQTVEKVYGAPPLLNQQLKAGRLDAVLTYWQFAARLQAEGYRQFMSGEEIIRGLGIRETVPSLGYVFKQDWAEQHRAALQHFLHKAHTAKTLLCESDAAWQQVAQLTETDDETTRQQLRQHYCEGLVKHWGVEEQQAAGRIYQLLHRLGDNKLTGQAEQLQAGTFWPGN